MKPNSPNVSVSTPSTIADLEKLLQTAWRTDKVIFMALILGTHLGLRRREILSLTFSDLHCHNLMNPAFTRFLELFPKMDPTARVVPLTESEYTKRMQSVRQAAGISAWGPDRIRKNFAVHAQWTAVLSAEQMKALGHDQGNQATKDFYTDEATSLWAQAFEKLSPETVLEPPIKPIEPKDVV